MSPHAALIEQLSKKRNLKITGFWRNLVLALGDWSDTLDGIEKIKPDLFEINTDRQNVNIFEVEVSHSVNQEKLQRVARLSLALDDVSWTLHLYTVGKWGQESEIELHSHVMALFQP